MPSHIDLPHLYEAYLKDYPENATACAVLAVGQLLIDKLEGKPNDKLSVKQLAKSLGVSEKTVREMEKSGKLPSKRIGIGRGVLRFDPADVAACGNVPQLSRPTEARRRRLLGF